MTVADWKEKMRVIQEFEKAKIELSQAQWSVMYEQAAMALHRPGIAKVNRVPLKPILPEPDFSLDELEKAQKVIDGLG